MVVDPATTGWLIDKSALVRLGRSPDAARWAERIERGVVRIATVTLLEVGYSARSADELRDGLREAPVGAMPVEYATPAAEDRAVDVLMKRQAGRGSDLEDLSRLETAHGELPDDSPA